MAEEYIAEVELLGHKAHVSEIKGRLSDKLFHNEDTLGVWLTFDEAVDGVLSFGIDLPAKKYSKTEFLDLVVKQGEMVMKKTRVKNARERAQVEAREERQKWLDNLAQAVGAEVSKKPE